MDTAVAYPIKCVAGARRHRSLFLSDLHLGHFGSRADHIIRFLRMHTADVYYLVGDILDLWIPKSPVWSCDQAAVIAHLRQRHAEGARLIYIRGNHDRSPENAPPAANIPVEVVDSAVHQALDGRKYWVIHGDGQDTSFFNSHAFSIAGHQIARAIASLEGSFANAIGRQAGKRNDATNYLVSSFYQMMHPRSFYQKNLALEAERRGFDGVICGHFHQPDLLRFGRTVYANCGDWIHSFTALAESHDGNLNLLERRSSYRPRLHEAPREAVTYT
jgi:UDP-2,3-diacylglucosamine pyrophosphatase LpxH